MSCVDLPSTNLSSLFVDMEVDDLAKFMFLENINNAVIELSLGGVESNKDLFCFLVDLLCKGLVLSYGFDNRVEIDNLTFQDFQKIQQKIGCAGIQVHLEVKENTEGDIAGVNMYEIDRIDDNAPLYDFTLKLTSVNNIYHIKFSLSHKVI